MYSPIEARTDPQDNVFAVSRRLCGAEVICVDRCIRTGNNRVYRIRTADASFALKDYGAKEFDEGDRIEREFEGLRFLNEMGLGSLAPTALAVDRRSRYALYEWVDGTAIASHGFREIAAVLELMGILHGARVATGALALPLAKEAVLCVSAVWAQIVARLGRLRGVSRTERDLYVFLADELQPAIDRQAEEVRGLDGHTELTPELRTLSPSDMGFHNALRRSDNSLTFIDFEYFGWDDPTKLVADFLWHPAMDLSVAEQRQFLDGAASVYGGDPAFTGRLKLSFPLFGIRWILIVLNEFLPEMWERRRFSGAVEDWDTAKRGQLIKARAMLTKLHACTQGAFGL